MTLCTEAIASTDSKKWFSLAAVTNTKSAILSDVSVMNDALGGVSETATCALTSNGWPMSLYRRVILLTASVGEVAGQVLSVSVEVSDKWP